MNTQGDPDRRTNLYTDQIIPPKQLPLAMTAHTPCFRSEAGSYGKYTGGILRLHQFSKAEMVRVCAAEDSAAQLQSMVGHAEALVAMLSGGHLLFDDLPGPERPCWQGRSRPPQSSSRSIS